MQLPTSAPAKACAGHCYLATRAGLGTSAAARGRRARWCLPISMPIVEVTTAVLVDPLHIAAELSMTLPAATAHYYAAAEHSPSGVTPTLNTNKSDLQRKPTRRQDQTGASLVQGARLLYISKQNSVRSELFADATGRIDRNHVYGQRPNTGPSPPWAGAAPGAYSVSGVAGHRVHGGPADRP